MDYINRSHVLNACKDLKAFYLNLAAVYNSSDMSLESNRGRRNILMSAPMEHFLAKALRSSYANVENDGRTGKADIVIKTLPSNAKEIECKLTSPQESSGSICFQTDYETLAKKKKLDYIYLIADETFNGFCAIYFKDLTLSDFRNLSTGARGKVQMIKHKAMKKASVLMGSVTDLTLQSLKRKEAKFKLSESKAEKRILNWKKQREALPDSKKQEKERLALQIKKAQINLNNRINKNMNEIKIKKEQKSRYKINFETMEQ